MPDTPCPAAPTAPTQPVITVAATDALRRALYFGADALNRLAMEHNNSAAALAQEANPPQEVLQELAKAARDERACAVLLTDLYHEAAAAGLLANLQASGG